MFVIDKDSIFKNLKFLAIFTVATFFIQRLIFLVWSLTSVSWSFKETIFALAIGFVFDLSFLLYAFIPHVVLFLLLPKLKNQKVAEKLAGYTLDIFNFFFVFFVLYMTISEFFFFDEFKARYNFIAVDYLVYTTEVLKNIWESYPVIKVLIGLTIASLIVVMQINSRLEIKLTQNKFIKNKGAFIGAFLLAFFANYFLIQQNLSEFPQEVAYQEISKNGVYSLFNAYFENQINYDQFYLKSNNSNPVVQVQGDYQKNFQFQFENTDNLKRFIKNKTQENPKMNVMLVLMESMSAPYMNAFGNTKNITPNLDSLATKGLFFNNFYATGTRTVRGIEAVTLSVPPTPGQSIVRRPGNEDLYSINKVFYVNGYDVEFVYGGYAYFDNMKYFFESNHATVYDQTSVPKDKITFSNAWGMSDEDIFNLSIDRADAVAAENKPFFQFILTTSNHRPFTFPEGRIDIKSGTGREGAVKYADYAIGRFISQAKNKKWFNNTIFIFVADHQAGVAGNIEINKDEYKIPLIIYSPQNIKPQVISDIGSQVDVAPTVLALAKLDYNDYAYGVDLLKYKPKRAFISNYQKIGFLKDDLLTILEPVRKYKQIELSKAETKANETSDLQEAIAVYQSASSLYKSGKLRTSDNSDATAKR